MPVWTCNGGLPQWSGKKPDLRRQLIPRPKLELYPDASDSLGILVRQLAPRALVKSTNEDGHHMEGAICNSCSSTHLGDHISTGKRFFFIVIIKL